MEPNEIQALIEKYYQGETTVEEEQALFAYFAAENIHPSLSAYAAEFRFFGAAKEEETSASFELRLSAALEKNASTLVPSIPQQEGKRIQLWTRRTLQAAAVILLIAGFGLGYFVNDLRHGNDNEQMEQLRVMTAMSLLKQESPHDKLQGMEVAKHLKKSDPRLLKLLLELINNDEQSSVKLGAIQSVAPYSKEEEVQDELIDAIANQYSALIQLSIIRALPRAKDDASRNKLRKLLLENNIDPEVKREIQKSL